MKVLRNLAVAALVVAAACGGGASNSVTGTTGGNNNGGSNPGGTTDTPVATNAVTIGDNVFTPASIVVSPGTQVTWTWPSGVAVHNVTFSDGTNSGDKPAGSTYSRTFSTAGTFNYTCTLHAGMNGTVKVQ
jgi:plastocyanin